MGAASFGVWARNYGPPRQEEVERRKRQAIKDYPKDSSLRRGMRAISERKKRDAEEAEAETKAEQAISEETVT